MFVNIFTIVNIASPSGKKLRTPLSICSVMKSFLRNI
jgi:uncharacterized protein YhhL (DUF1145 family)